MYIWWPSNGNFAWPKAQPLCAAQVLFSLNISVSFCLSFESFMIFMLLLPREASMKLVVNGVVLFHTFPKGEDPSAVACLGTDCSTATTCLADGCGVSLSDAVQCDWRHCGILLRPTSQAVIEVRGVFLFNRGSQKWWHTFGSHVAKCQSDHTPRVCEMNHLKIQNIQNIFAIYLIASWWFHPWNLFYLLEPMFLAKNAR